MRNSYCKVLLLSIVFCTGTVASAQDFTISIYFEDATGNKDTIVSGAAQDANWGYDPQYDSENINGVARHPNLDVRLSTNRPWNFSNLPDNYQAKTNIIPYEWIIFLEVSTSSWPITMNWRWAGTPTQSVESSFLSDDFGFEVDGTAPSESLTLLNITSSKPSGVGNAILQRSTSNLAVAGDTIHVYALSFRERPVSTFSVLTPNATQLKLFPNPVEAKLQLTGTLTDQITSAVLYDVFGRQIKDFARMPGEIPTADLLPGYYLLLFTDKQGRRWSKRFIKQ
ncbi:MAG: T9SS type A sorting domain-containing protein [Bacteroidota bacterium]